MYPDGSIKKELLIKSGMITNSNYISNEMWIVRKTKYWLLIRKIVSHLYPLRTSYWGVSINLAYSVQCVHFVYVMKSNLLLLSISMFLLTGTF